MNNIPDGSDCNIAPWNDKTKVVHSQDKPKCPVHNVPMDEYNYSWECPIEWCMEIIEKECQED